MKHQWYAYGIVALLSVAAGIAIAGLPNDVPVDATIVVPEPTDASTTVPAPEPSTTVATTTPGTTEPATTEPDPSASTTVDSTAAPTTAPPADLPPRSELVTIVANGANVSGAASRNIEQLRAIGYTDIAARNGTLTVDVTDVYYADGLQAAALRLADDLTVAPERVAELADAPEVIDLPDGVELLVYIGIDRAG